MKKITTLTEEQKARFPEFIQKWTDIGLSTSPANRKEAEAGIIEAYAIAGLPAPKIVWCGSPLSQGLTRALIFGLKDAEWKDIQAKIGDSVRDSVRDSVWDSGYGQHDANWIGFYDYFKIVCGLEKETQKISGLWKIAANAGWFLPHKNLCWVSERHTVLHRNTQGRLHKDGSAALEYPDGFSIFALNGVRMKPCYVTTAAEQIDPKVVLAETNVEVRRELIRKIGMERFLSVVPHKRLEIRGNYELLSIPLSNEIQDSRWLKMVNPSVGCFHVEAVAPECSTVQQAINWRAGNIKVDWAPEVLT